MKLFNYKHRYDFGHDWYVQILNTGRHYPRFMRDYSLLQMSISWNDFPTWPYIQIKSGYGSTLSFSFWVYKFGIDIGIIERTWIWDRKDEQETELD